MTWPPAFWTKNRLRLRMAAGLALILSVPTVGSIFPADGLVRVAVILGCPAIGVWIWARAWIAEGDPPPPNLADCAAQMPQPEPRP